jgi:DNA-binding HxlR family transcriptional regulator
MGVLLQNNIDMPVAGMVEDIVGCKWSMRLLSLLEEGPQRPSALLRACPGLSTKVMNERLRKLSRWGMVEKTVRGDKPPLEVDYALTGLGARFGRVIQEVRALQSELESADRIAQRSS